MMKCMTCESEINPKWKHAIDSNVCPFCGQNVVDDKLRELFVDLRVLMDELEEYKEQLEDWLLSNYSFVRTTSSSLVNYIPKELLKGNPQKIKEEGSKFIVKVKTDKGEEDVIAEKTQSEETTNEFFKRAEAVKPRIDGFTSAVEKTKHLKTLANQIKNAGTKVITSDDVELMSVDMDDVDQDAVEEMQTLFSQPQISSSLTDEEDLDIPPALLAMANNNKSNTSDLIKLQQMQLRINKSRQNFQTGNVGKNGFTRSS